MAGAVASAAADQLIDRAFSLLTEKYGKQAAVGEKLQRLEMLLIKIRSVIEESEKHALESSLLQWRDKLKEAVSQSQGDEVLAVFKQRAAEATDRDNQGGASVAGALSFTRSYLSGMVQGLRDATKTLFSSDKEVEKLNVAVERLEKLSVDVGEFLTLLQLQLQPKPEPSRKRKERAEKLVNIKPEPSRKRKESPVKEPPVKLVHVYPWTPASLPQHLMLKAAGDKESQVWRALQHKLAEALGKIRRANEVAEGRDLKSSGGLAQWAAVLREAWLQGQAAHHFLQLRPRCMGLGKHEALGSEPEGEHVTEERMFSLVRSLEMLAGEVDSFSRLVELCPRAPAE